MNAFTPFTSSVTYQRHHPSAPTLLTITLAAWIIKRRSACPTIEAVTWIRRRGRRTRRSRRCSSSPTCAVETAGRRAFVAFTLVTVAHVSHGTHTRRATAAAARRCRAADGCRGCRVAARVRVLGVLVVGRVTRWAGCAPVAHAQCPAAGSAGARAPRTGSCPTREAKGCTVGAHIFLSQPRAQLI